MKVLISTNPPCESWVSSQVPKEVLLNMLDVFLSKAVLVEDENFINTIREIKVRYPQLLSLVYEKIKTTPRTQRAKQSDIDCVLSSPDDVTSFTYTPKFIESFGRHTAIGKPGELREVFYERSFGHLLRNAKFLEIYDPYALENLGNHHKGISWLIREKLSKLPLKVVLHTSFSRGSKKYLCWEDALDSAVDNLKHLENSNAEFSLSTLIYESNKFGKHDRFGKIGFDYNSVSFELSKGAEIFGDPILREGYKPHPLTLHEYEVKASSWPQGSVIAEEQLIQKSTVV